MKPITIVANIIAKPGKIDLVKTELQKLIAPTRSEKGCMQYELHQDNENPAHFLFFEIWESRELWQDHMNSPHLATCVSLIEDSLAELTVKEMSLVD